MNRYLYATLAIPILVVSATLRAQDDAQFVAENLKFSREFYSNIHFVAIAKAPASFAYDRYPAAESERIRCDDGTYARQRGKPWLKSQDWAETGTPADAKTVRKLEGWIKLINDAMNVAPDAVKLIGKSQEDGRNQWLFDVPVKGEKTKPVRLRFAKPLYENDEDVLLHGISGSTHLDGEKGGGVKPVELSFGYLIQAQNDYELSERAWEDMNRPKAGAPLPAPAPKPKDALAYDERGKARAMKGDMAGAIVDFGRAITLDPKLSAAYYERAVARRTVGDLEGALGDFDRAIELAPNDGDIYNERGIARRRKGNLDGAIADYSRAIELNPKAGEMSYYNRALAREVKNDGTGALADYTSVLELNPKNANAYKNRGDLKQKANDLDGAISDFTKAIELNPNLASAYQNRGKAHQAKGDAAAATADLKHATELQSGH